MCVRATLGVAFLLRLGKSRYGNSACDGGPLVKCERLGPAAAIHARAFEGSDDLRLRLSQPGG